MEKGFTLVELMVVLALISITIGLTGPMARMYTNSNAASHMNEFVSNARFARSHAITSGNSVILCPLTEANQLDTPTECTDTTNWHNGWVVFMDSDGDGSIGNGTADPSDDETILRFHDALPDNYTLTTDTRRKMIFQSNGLATGSNAIWTLCVPSLEDRLARGVSLAVSGRIRLAEDGDADGIREIGNTDLSCGTPTPPSS